MPRPDKEYLRQTERILNINKKKKRKKRKKGKKNVKKKKA